ncbi:hypothetical protein [Anaerocolumna xylanovorans]|uniref:hypothetical protein n=1 Tax=Anaerocolumna xylanovorans TaxID=100134 RepID=UPI00158826B3|nr:hypothetical protein [Anaerocolumna xylanovorans]
MEQTAYVLLFCLGVSLLLLSYKNIGDSIGLLKNSTARQNVLREQEIMEYKGKEHILTVTRAEVIGYLTGSLEADIRIDGISYPKDSFDRDSFDYSILPEGIYNKGYVLDGKDFVIEMIFTHRN